MRLTTALLGATALAFAAATPAAAAAAAGTTHVRVSPPTNGSVVTTTCDPPAGQIFGTGTLHLAATCFRGDVGTASGEAVAAEGHIGASAHADSHNGDSLAAGIESEAGFRDNSVIFTSSDPNATTASVSANFILEGFLEATGPIASAGVQGGLEGFGGGTFQFILDQAGNLSIGNSFIVDSGTVGGVTDLHMHTAFTLVPLNTPVFFSLGMFTGANASGPGSHALSDFGVNSFKFAPTAFNLPDGVTVNAGDYLVNNRFIDPLAAPGGGVPEPASWALMIAGFGLAGAALRRRRATLA